MINFLFNHKRIFENLILNFSKKTENLNKNKELIIIEFIKCIYLFFIKIMEIYITNFGLKRNFILRKIYQYIRLI